MQYRSQFLQSTIDQLSTITHLARIRIQKAEFHIEPDNAYFLGAFMDVPPALGMIELSADKINIIELQADAS